MNLSMRSASAIMTLALAAMSFAPPASAARVIWDIGAKHSASKIKSECDKAGGDFYQDAGSYGCEETDAGASVYCTGDGKCHAVVPDRPAAGGAQPSASTLEDVFGTDRR